MHPAFASCQQPYTVYNGALKANINELISNLEALKE